MGMYYGTCIYCGKYCFKDDEYVKTKGNRKTIWFHRKCYEAEQAEIREKRNREVLKWKNALLKN